MVNGCPNRVILQVMKKIIFLLLLSGTIAVQAQDYKTVVTSQFLQYYEHIRNKEFEKAAEYMNPAFFKIIPKDQLITAMGAVFNTPGMEFETDAATIKEVGPVVVKDKMQYVKLAYNSVIRIRMTGEMAADPALLKANFERQFGKENVSYNDSTKFYSINTQKKAVGNSTDGKKWTFVVVEPRQVEILKQFIPEDLLKD